MEVCIHSNMFCTICFTAISSFSLTIPHSSGYQPKNGGNVVLLGPDLTRKKTSTSCITVAYSTAMQMHCHNVMISHRGYACIALSRCSDNSCMVTCALSCYQLTDLRAAEQADEVTSNIHEALALPHITPRCHELNQHPYQ